MIVYKRAWLENIEIQKEAENAFKENFISEEELKAIKDQYPVACYHPGIFIRIGLFILTFIICIFSAFLIFSSNGFTGNSIVSIIITLSCLFYAALEIFVNIKHHFKSGTDDALLWATGIFFTAGLFMKDLSSLTISIYIFILSLFLSLRFINYLMSVISYSAFICIIFHIVLKYDNFFREAFPFIVLTICATIYFIIKKYQNRSGLKYFSSNILALEIVALCIFYMAGNVYIVSEINYAMFPEHNLGTGYPLAWFSWITSFIIPVMYLFFGIIKKDVILLRVGLLSIVGLAFTIRYYYHLVPMESVLIVSGILVSCTIYFLIKYLSQPKKGFIYKAVNRGNSVVLPFEGLIAGGITGNHATAHNTKFGGGSGGGAGAGGSF